MGSTAKHQYDPKIVNTIENRIELPIGWVELTDEDMSELSSLPDRFKVCGDSRLPIRIFFAPGDSD
jgi:hypothetical protein